MDKNISFDEYNTEVRRCFYEISGLSEDEGEVFLNSETAENKIKSSYKYFTTSDVAGFEPPAVAGCLDMMYEG